MVFAIVFLIGVFQIRADGGHGSGHEPNSWAPERPHRSSTSRLVPEPPPEDALTATDLSPENLPHPASATASPLTERKFSLWERVLLVAFEHIVFSTLVLVVLVVVAVRFLRSPGKPSKRFSLAPSSASEMKPIGRLAVIASLLPGNTDTTILPPPIEMPADDGPSVQVQGPISLSAQPDGANEVRFLTPGFSRSPKECRDIYLDGLRSLVSGLLKIEIFRIKCERDETAPKETRWRIWIDAPGYQEAVVRASGKEEGQAWKALLRAHKALGGIWTSHAVERNGGPTK